ncbi:DNA-3-methyladenine glycosylase I [bacterium]|nr:DNA-3-methyladenine glycosylase I [bacterium]
MKKKETNCPQSGILPDRIERKRTPGSTGQTAPGVSATQSGILPYQINSGKLRVLLITNRSGKKWIIPKGKIEPGMNALSSAEKEAYEEAGIRGGTHSFPIGKFRHAKDGLPLDIEVYAMSVEAVLDDWPESGFRIRRWCSVEEAAGLTENRELANLIRLLPEWLELKNERDPGLPAQKPRMRCPWCGTDPLYRAYHDLEWGVPVHDETRHFEFLLLETMQAGLSWLIILKKREHFRKAFDGFDFRKIAVYKEKKIQKLMENPGIIRNRKKIEAAVNNARCFMAVQKEFGSFDRYIWNFVKHRPIQNHWKILREIPTGTALSDRISRDMKKRGFRFVGSTIVYSHLQAIGLINDHLTGCFRHAEIKKAAERSMRPSD